MLSDFTELFDTVTPKDVFGAQLLKSYGKQKEVIEKWEENLQTIADRANNDQFIQELRKFGEKAAPEITALNTLSTEQLQEYISLYQEKKKNSRGGRVFTTWDGRPMHPDTISQWFPGFIRAYNAKEAFNSEISAARNKLSAQELTTLEDLKEQYLKLTTTKMKSLKEKMTSIENAITEIIGHEGLERIQQGQKLPPLPFHGLRHTSITMLIAQGIPLPNVSRRAGHATTSTTANIYAHVLKNADKEAAEKLDKLYNEKLQRKAR